MSLTVPTSSEFPTLAREGLVYLDTAATSQTVRPAIEEMDRYYQTYRASIHRGIYEIASEATDAYEGARATVARFVGGADEEVVFTKNATESLNLVAYAFSNSVAGQAKDPRLDLHEGDEILITEMEHHANLVPWQELALVQSWVNEPSSNMGLVIQNLDASDRLVFDSREATRLGDRPKLAVSFMEN